MKLLEVLTYSAIVSEISAATFRAPVHVAKRAIDTRKQRSKHSKQESAKSSPKTPKKSRGFQCQDAQKCGPLSRYGAGQHYMNDVKHSKPSLFDVGEVGDETPVWVINSVISSVE